MIVKKGSKVWLRWIGGSDGQIGGEIALVNYIYVFIAMLDCPLQPFIYLMGPPFHSSLTQGPKLHSNSSDLYPPSRRFISSSSLAILSYSSFYSCINLWVDGAIEFILAIIYSSSFIKRCIIKHLLNVKSSRTDISSLRSYAWDITKTEGTTLRNVFIHFCFNFIKNCSNDFSDTSFSKLSL